MSAGIYVKQGGVLIPAATVPGPEGPQGSQGPEGPQGVAGILVLESTQTVADIPVDTPIGTLIYRKA